MSTKQFTITASVLFALAVAVTPVLAACDLQHPEECNNNELLQLIASLGSGDQSQTPTQTPTQTPSQTLTAGAPIAGIPEGFQFTKTLKMGSTGTEVKYLQIFLNSDPDTAVGNAGKETTYFGSLTKAAVNKFQQKYASEILTPLGLTAPTGVWASASRAKANAILAAGVSAPVNPNLPAGCTSTSGYSPVTGQPCSSVSNLPAGCTSTSGYSPVTGQPCSSGTTSPNEPVGAGFTVRLASDNPASSTFVQGQATADLAHFTFSNGTGSEVKVTSLELTRIGVSQDSTLSNVYLFDGATRLTDAASVSSGKATFNATTGLFTIPANSTKTIIVKSDIANGSNGQTIGVSLSGVTSDGALTTTLPIAGNIFNIANATLASVTIGTVLPNGATTTDPVAGVRVWEATFTVNNRNVQFTKLVLKQINSIDKTDLSNFKLLIDGVEVASAASLDANNYVTFTFDKTLVTGARNVKVLADVNGGSSRYIQMSLRNKADVDLKDTEYNVNVAVTGAPATANTIQVNQGVFTITKNNAALPITVANNASNQLIGKWTFKATGEAVKVETLTAGFNYVDAAGGNNTTATLRNGKLMINGTQAGSTATLVPTGTPYTINYTFQPGVETTVELYADIYDNDGAAGQVGLESGDTIAAKLIVGSANGTKQISLGTIDVPTATQATSSVLSAITVAQGVATVVATPTYSSPQNTVIPRTAMKIGSWIATASTAEDINVNNLRFAIAPVTDDSFEVGDMYDMYVVYKVGSNAEVTSSIRPTPTTPADFPVSFTLPRTQTVTINLYASLLDNGLNNASTPGAENIDAGDSVRATLTISGTGAQSGAAANFGAATNGQLIVYQSASLVVTKDASSPVAALVAGNNTIKAASYKFEASNDNYDVIKLVYGITDASAVSMVNLKDGSTILQSQPAANTVTFTGFVTPITITSGAPKVLDVELVLSNVGTGAGNTGADVTVDLNGATSLVRASDGSTSGLAPEPASGNAMYAYKAVPNITLVSLPTSILAAGTNTIAKFTVGTNGTGTIGWKKISFKVSKTDASGSDLGAITAVTLVDANNNTPISGTAVIASALGSLGSQTGTIDFYPTAEEQTGSKTYALKVNVGGTVGTGDSITTMIDNPSASHIPSTTFTTGTGTAAGTTTLTYVDGDGSNTVTAGDVRQTAVSKYTTTDVSAASTVVGHTSANKIVQSYGIPASFVMTLAEDATTDNTIGAATFTVTGVTGLTCTPYTGTDYTGAITVGTTKFSDIKSISCNGSGMQLRLTGMVITDDTDTAANTGTLTITVTKATDYAVNSVVAAGDSDLGIALATSGGVPATASFIWSDLSATSHSVSTPDWTNDYLVKFLPTDTQNLTK